jgi:hypothetical protein
MGYNNFCISSYLTFRYVVKDGVPWKEGVLPEYPDCQAQGRYKVKSGQQVLQKLRQSVSECCRDRSVGILLSGGIDSAILAALMPAGTLAYTVKFHAENAVDESQMARVLADAAQLKHKTVDVTWDDYLEHMDFLMQNKKSPLHPAEVGLYLAAKQAASEGMNMLIVGNGADSTFGGMDKLLSKDWGFDEFVARYTFVEPSTAVKDPVSMRDTYEAYRTADGINVQGFLKVTHGIGIIQMFENAIHSAGCKILAPYEELSLDGKLDLERIRSGDTKYILRDVFRLLYPGQDIPDKIPFARPMEQWMSGWQGPARPEFLDNLPMDKFTGEQKWLIYCLERFMNLMEAS